jgi:alkanesulfonate monooxygenase SsuD/methylene tetrahydromethanopterin reductase-like flavin-dependent oxidoreductase (luciferase family)
VEFGIFFELSTPSPGPPGIDRVVIGHALEQARLADELGFDVVWAVEHHFLEEYSHCSAPEVLLAAIAAQTRRVRVGHGAVICVPGINHPVRVAERAAMLDIISDGRLEVGTARSSTWTELGGFGVDPDTTKKAWDEFVRVLPRMWADEPFEHVGFGFSMPERNVIPKPVQRPHPPMWVTVTSPGTELDAADRGLGCLGVASAGYAEQERRTAEYRRRIQLCEPVGAVNDKVATLNYLYCHEDHDRARRTGMRMVNEFRLTNAHLLSTREAYPTRAYQHNALLHLVPKVVDAGDPGAGPPVPEGTVVGDPAHVLAAIRHWESIGVDQVNVIVNALEVIPQQEVLDSLRLFAAEVLPAFRPPSTVAAAVAPAPGR